MNNHQRLIWVLVVFCILQWSARVSAQMAKNRHRLQRHQRGPASDLGS
jgi:hypothetical protein